MQDYYNYNCCRQKSSVDAKEWKSHDWDTEYLYSFKLPPYKLLINNKVRGSNCTVVNPGSHHPVRKPDSPHVEDLKLPVTDIKYVMYVSKGAFGWSQPLDFKFSSWELQHHGAETSHYWCTLSKFLNPRIHEHNEWLINGGEFGDNLLCSPSNWNRWRLPDFSTIKLPFSLCKK